MGTWEIENDVVFVVIHGQENYLDGVFTSKESAQVAIDKFKLKNARIYLRNMVK